MICLMTEAVRVGFLPLLRFQASAFISDPMDHLHPTKPLAVIKAG